MEIGILAGIGAMVGFGFADFFAARASKENGPVQTIFFSQLLGLLVLGAVFLIKVGSFSLSSALLIWIALLSLGFTLALFFFFRSLEIGPVSITTPIAASASLLTVLFSVFFLGEILELRQLGAVALIIAGMLFAIVQFEKLKLKISDKKGILFALLAMFLWGVTLALWGDVVDSIGWFLATVLGYFFMTGWLVVLFGLRKGGLNKLWGSGLKRNIVIATALYIFGVVSFNFGLERHLTSIVVAIANTSPVITIFLALKKFDENVQLTQVLGSLAIVSGLVLLAVG